MVCFFILFINTALTGCGAAWKWIVLVCVIFCCVCDWISVSLDSVLMFKLLVARHFMPDQFYWSNTLKVCYSCLRSRWYVTMFSLIWVIESSQQLLLWSLSHCVCRTITSFQWRRGFVKVSPGICGATRRSFGCVCVPNQILCLSVWIQASTCWSDEVKSGLL